jgi:hypothetical protein
LQSLTDGLKAVPFKEFGFFRSLFSPWGMLSFPIRIFPQPLQPDLAGLIRAGRYGLERVYENSILDR